MIVTTLTTNTSTSELSAHNGAIWLHLSGTFGSGTATLEYKLPGTSTWVAYEGGAFTVGPVNRVVSAPAESPVRVTLSGATNPSLTVHLQARRILRAS